MKIEIVNFHRESHEAEVVRLWNSVFGYDQPRNDPRVVIDRKLEVSDGLFFVAEMNSQVCGTVMCGYDGHRGWIYSLAVFPVYQGKGVGKRLMAHAEKALRELGCMKINLQILEDNSDIQEFYLSLGYATEKRISMGKEIAENIPNLEQAGPPDGVPGG